MCFERNCYSGLDSEPCIRFFGCKYFVDFSFVLFVSGGSMCVCVLNVGFGCVREKYEGIWMYTDASWRHGIHMSANAGDMYTSRHVLMEGPTGVATTICTACYHWGVAPKVLLCAPRHTGRTGLLRLPTATGKYPLRCDQ